MISILMPIFMLCMAVPALAIDYELCVRGVGDTFTRTAHVQVSIEGAELGQDANVILAPLIKRLVWQGHAEKVFVDIYDAALCSASLGERQEIALSITQAEVDQLKVDLVRGSAEDSQIAVLLSQRAMVSSDFSSTNPDGKYPYFTLRIYYATNRRDTGALHVNEKFVSDRADGITFGAVHITIPRDHRMGELETPSILKLEFHEDENKHITLESLQPLDHATWRAELRTRATALGKPGVLLFIHGYNVGFREAGIRTAQLSYDLGFPGPAIFFSWPSHGALFPYTADEQAAEWSVPDMKQVLADLAGLGPEVPIYVIAHSMGNRVLTRAFKDLLDEDMQKRRAFKEIVLTAPDLDADVFTKQLAPAILGRGPRVTLYASSQDLALVGSRKFHGGYRRLGEIGTALTVLPDMDTVDASNVKTDFLGHSFFGDSTTVITDLFCLIRKRQKPGERGLVPANSPAGEYWRFKTVNTKPLAQCL